MNKQPKVKKDLHVMETEAWYKGYQSGRADQLREMRESVIEMLELDKRYVRETDGDD